MEQTQQHQIVERIDNTKKWEIQEHQIVANKGNGLPSPMELENVQTK
jgi:hypothetical protein